MEVVNNSKSLKIVNRQIKFLEKQLKSCDLYNYNFNDSISYFLIVKDQLFGLLVLRKLKEVLEHWYPDDIPFDELREDLMAEIERSSPIVKNKKEVSSAVWGNFYEYVSDEFLILK